MCFKGDVMKRLLFYIVCVLCVAHAQAQVASTTALLGAWSGKLKFGIQSLTLVLHMEQKDGYVVIALDSPDQGAKGIGAFKEFLSDDSIAVRFDALNASYRAHLLNGRLEGKFTQNGIAFRLSLERGVPEVKRPQRPQPPYPYKAEEVSFINEADGATLAGTLTYPVGYDASSSEKPAVVLFVSGSGQQNRDEEIFSHAPFHVLADYLARRGIASLRYDDRATGSSVGGEVKSATTEDFMRDAAAGISFLREQKAFGRVGCLGHSEGGSIAFMLGAQGLVDFIVSLAAPGVKGDTLLAAQSNCILSLSGRVADMTVEKVHQLDAVKEIPWMKWFVTYDPSAHLQATRCPVFALNGERDVQVIASLNLPAIRRLLPSSPRHLFKSYPALNHLFQHCTTGLPTEYGQIEETISPEVLRDIADWIGSLEGVAL